MKIAQLMTTGVQFVSPSATIADAARKMQQLDCGFLPVADDAEQALQGVVTDRDIVVRGIAKGLDPKTTSVDEVRTDRVLYCLASDDLQTAARKMYEQQVSRLIVLSNAEEKRLRGVISLGDITRNSDVKGEALVGFATRGMKETLA